MNEEIEKYIKRKGIGQYLFEMGIDFSIIQKSYDLINYDLKNVGLFINFHNIKYKDILIPNCIKNLRYIDHSNYFIGILLCLVIPMSKIFCDRNKLITIIEEDSIYTKYFYKITQDLLNFDYNENNNNLYLDFMKEIQKSNSKDIFNDIKSLIEFLLLKLHDEQKTDNNNQRIKNSETKLYESYNTEKEMINNFYSINNSDIRKLFFFDLEFSYHCQNCKEADLQYYVNCILEFNLEETKNKFKNNNIDIYKILDCINIEDNNYCECNKPVTIQKYLNYCPQYLIIFIRKKEANDIKFFIHETINVKKYVSKNYKDSMISYELVSLIQNTLITLCKSEVDKQWYKYEAKYEGNYAEKWDLNKNNDIFVPYLLIYKKKDKFK